MGRDSPSHILHQHYFIVLVVKTLQLLSYCQLSNLKRGIKDLDVISLIDENMKRQKETQFLQENNEMLLRQIEYLQKENCMLSANDSTDEGPNEKDLVIVQLEQEIQDLTEELSQISEDKLMLEKQLGY